MSAAMLYRQAARAGVTLRLVEGKVKAFGSDAVLATLVPQLREHKAELVEFLQDAHVGTARLIAAAMRCCDTYHDNAAKRAEMRADCLQTPLHLRKDLLKHFTRPYGEWPKASEI